MRDIAPVRKWAIAGVALGAALGAALTFWPRAQAARNSVGIYSLPSGNPVTAHTAISSTWANTTLGDLAAEMTNSLDRGGRGAMTGALQLANGTSSNPGLTFSSEPTSGLYRAAAGDVRMQVGGGQSQKWTSAGATIPGTLNVNGLATLTGGASFTAGSVSFTPAPTFSGGATFSNGATFSGGSVLFTPAATFSNGATFSQSATGSGLTATGGSATGDNGVRGTGGATDGTGVAGFGGGTNGLGVVGFGTGTAFGGDFTGGASGNGLRGTAGGAAATGVIGQGAAGGAGVIGIPGTAATSSVRQTALAAQQGDIQFTTVTNPDTSHAAANALTPKNFVKVWAHIAANASTSPTVADGYNISSAVGSSTTLTLHFTVPFSVAGYACTFSSTSTMVPSVVSQTTSQIAVQMVITATSTVMDWTTDNTDTISVICIGAQ